MAYRDLNDGHDQVGKGKRKEAWSGSAWKSGQLDASVRPYAWILTDSQKSCHTTSAVSNFISHLVADVPPATWSCYCMVLEAG